MELASNYLERWNKFRNDFSHIIKTYLPQYDTQLNLMRGDLNNIPNVLLYGVFGFPLDLLWKEGLKRRFNIKTECFIEKSCTWGKNIPYMETPYYIHIDMSNPEIPSDLDMLQELLKTIITTKSIQTERHIIILENIDHFINKNRHAFRVLLERFSKNVWFICTTYHYSTLESPLRSRFQSIRFSLPTETEVNKIIHYLDINNDNNNDNIELYKTRNIIKAFTIPKNKDENFYWMASLNYPPLSQYILTTSSTSVSIDNIRAIVYKAYQAGVSISEFAYDIIEICIKRGDHQDDIDSIIKKLTLYQHMSSQSKGTRILLYMEYMLHYVMTLVNVSKPKKITKKVIRKKEKIQLD